VKRKSLDPTKNRRSALNIIVENTDKEKKHTEYLHEEIYDAESKNKWTIFNKHAIEIKEPDSEGDENNEEKLFDAMEKMQAKNDSCETNISMSTWIALYEAKCVDLRISSKSDKQQERFISQMKLIQRCDKINLRDHGLSAVSAQVIG